MANHNLTDLEKKIHEGFGYVYRANQAFLTSDSIYRQRCFEAIRDEALMRHIIFNNDYLKIPPVYTFLCYYANQEPKLPVVSKEDAWLKKSVGAFWGFIFRKVFLYDDARNDLLPGKFLGFRTASYFSQIPSENG